MHLPGQDSEAKGLTAMLTGTSLDLAQRRLPWFLGTAWLRQLVACMPSRGCPVNSDVMVVCAGSAVGKVSTFPTKSLSSSRLWLGL